MEKTIRDLFEVWCEKEYGKTGSKSPFTKSLKEKMFFAFSAGFKSVAKTKPNNRSTQDFQTHNINIGKSSVPA